MRKFDPYDHSESVGVVCARQDRARATKAILITAAIILLFFISLIGLSSFARNARNESNGSPGNLHTERAKAYHESLKAAEEHNGRPLTDLEKNELYQFSRTDAEINLEEQKQAEYDPSDR